MVTFHQLEVVGRGSETQLQVGENLNYLILLIINFIFHPLDVVFRHRDVKYL